ncbi:MAG: response regulator [Acidobacteria bacterium]|nr:response regulator [Acidobacteriota bacterium]
MILWLLGLSSLVGGAESGTPPLLHADSFMFSHLTIDQGLSQSNVFCIVQDRRGFMWFGTEDGLNRFDGYEFMHITHDPGDVNSLSNDTITALGEDSNGCLWVGTAKGLNRLDPETLNVRRIGSEAGEPRELGSVGIEAIRLDRQGRVWVATQGGLAVLEPGGRGWRLFQSDGTRADRLNGHEVSALLVDRQDRLWAGGFDGVVRRDSDGGRFHPIGITIEPAENETRQVNCLTEDADGVIWAGTNGGGLHRWDVRSGHFVHYPTTQHGTGAEPLRYINALAVDAHGRLWAGTHGSGIVVLDTVLNRYVHLLPDASDSHTISYPLVASVFRDRGDIMWIGTHGKGLDLWNPYQQKFERYRCNPADPHSMGVTSVRAILEDRDGQLWVGGYNGFDRLDRKTGRFEHLPQSWPNGIVRVLREDPDQPDRVIWLGMESGRPHLIAFDRIQKRIWKQYDFIERFGFHTHQIRDILLEADGSTWVGTNDGLLRFNRRTGAFARMTHDAADPGSLGHNQVNAIIRTSDSNLWVGTMGGGLSRLDPATGRFVGFRHRDGDPDSLINDNVMSLLEAEPGVLWIGTAGGLSRLELRTGRFTSFSTRHGLPNDMIYGILPDAQGRLWLSTNHGLARFDPASGTCRNFDVSDGLQSNEFNAGAHHRSRSGELFFGGIEGFNAFRPESIRDNPHAPPMAITALQIFNQPVHVGPMADGRVVLTRDITATSALELKHGDRVFTLGFAAMSPMMPGKNRHAYMLEGWDTDWNQVGSRRYATFVNLPPGEYVFRVIGSNSDGVWNRTGARLTIQIQPPFWATWWFRTLGLVGLALLVWSVHLARTVAIRKRNRELQTVNLALQEQIIERRRVEEALRLSEAKYRTLTDNLTVGIFRTSTGADARFVEVNPALAVILGHARREDILHRPAAEYFDKPDDWSDLVRQLEQAGRARLDVVAVRRPDGTSASCAVTAVAFRDPEGRLAGYDGLIEDISERRALENQIRQTQKMEAIGRLAGGVAHDFNNILTVINGRAEMALAELTPGEAAHRSVSEIVQGGRRAEDLIRQLLAFSRRQVIAPVVVDVNQVLVGLERMLRRLIGEDVQLQSVLAAGLPAIKADPGQLEQVFLNLVVNARDALAELGEGATDKQITITTSVAALDDEYILNHPEIQPGRYVVISVSDNGVGMTADIQSRIFEPFYTTKQAGRGTGLGLATVFGIVKQNSGAINVYSEPGCGSRFRVYWPAAPADDAAAAPRAPEVPPVGGRETILVVEDDLQVRQFASDGLRELGYHVLEADSGTAALRMLDDPAVSVHLLFTDVVMPGLSGIELAHRLPARLRGMPVLFASGYADHHLMADGSLKLGVNFIEKPYAIRALAARIRDLLGKLEA